ncbi:MAG: hypothetical protein ACT4OX_16510 [Actinomycetota bacterium]
MARRTRRRASTRDPRRVAGAIGLLGATVAVGAKAATAAFTSTATPTHATDTAHLDVDTSNPDVGQGFNVAVNGLYPGKAFERVVDVTISGDADLDNNTLGAPFGMWVNTTTNCGTCDSSLLDTDMTNGLQITIDRCSIAWTPSGSSPDKTYTCGGTQTSVQTITPITGGATTGFVGTKNLTKNATASLTTVGSVNRYRFTFSLPTTAPDTMEGLTGINGTIIELKFGGTQRDATNK